MALKKLLLTYLGRYLGRTPFAPINVGNYADFVAYLEQHATRSNSRSARKPALTGMFDSGLFFFESNGFILIRYEKRFGRTDWHFVGSLENNETDSQLEGQFKVSWSQELISCLALFAVLYGLMGLAGLVTSSWGLTFWLILIGSPVLLFIFRWLDGNVSLFGATAMTRISELLHSYSPRS